MSELSFLERLGLLVDQQWTWRENKALARRLQAAKLQGACVEDIDYRSSRGLDKGVMRALAQQALAKGTGARALRSILERLMLDVMYDIPSRGDVESVTLNRAAVLGKATPLLRKKQDADAA